MKEGQVYHKRLVTFLLAFIMIISINLLVFASDSIYLTDYTNTLNENEQKEIEASLSQIYKQSNIEYKIIIVQSLNNNSIEDISNETFRQIGLGDKENNNGLLIYISKDDHKYRMEVGYGLEGIITDTISKQIIDSMAEYFSNENYSEGILTAISETIDILNNSGEYNITVNEDYLINAKENKTKEHIYTAIILLIVFTFVEYFSVIRIHKKRYGRIYWNEVLWDTFMLITDIINIFFDRNSSSNKKFGGGSSGGGGASSKW